MARRKHRNPESVSAPSPVIAKASADAFFELSQAFIELLPDGLDSIHDHVDLAQLTASATNRALSLELYLKSLRILTGLEPTDKHDLWVLYRSLPPDVRAAVESMFDDAAVPALGVPAALEIALAPRGLGEPLPKGPVQATVQTDLSLPAVLRRAKDAFATWRYLHEKGHPTGYALYQYEFVRLGNAAKALRQVTEERLDLAGPLVRTPLFAPSNERIERTS